MSLMLLKTRDLTWQDRALNIEVMLEPRKTQLLFKKNKSLSMNYEKASFRYEKQRNALMRMYKNEKRYIEEKNQEYYLVRTQKFLETIPAVARREVLQRPSFSISLSKLTKEINEEEALNRASAPAALVGRNSKPLITFITDEEEEALDETSLPGLKPDEKELIKKLKLIEAHTKDGGLRSYRSSDDINTSLVPLSGKSKKPVYSSAHGSRSNTPIPSYLPTANSASTTNVTLPNLVPESFKNQNEDNEKPELLKLPVRDRSVKFGEQSKPTTPRDSYQYEKQKAENNKPKIQMKVNDFLMKQSQFNKQTRVVKKDEHRKTRICETETYGVDKNKLVNAFDELCTHGGRDKLQKLLKYATKYKVNSKLAKAPSIVPSVESAKASRTFQSLHPNVQLTTIIPQIEVPA